MKLSIIIPSKNEEKYIVGVIHSILNSNIRNSYEIIVSDISTDNTREIIKLIDPNIKIVDGGLTPYGRNMGASNAKGEYLLFIDSDITFFNPNLIDNVVNVLDEGNDLVTCKLRCRGNNRRKINLIYRLNNIIQKLSKLDKKPFSTGSFMGIRKEVFNRLGGFNEEVMHCEDYLLSKKVDHTKFKVLNEYVYTDDRRFQKMGILGMVKYFIKNIKNRNNDQYFKEDIGYWL